MQENCKCHKQLLCTAIPLEMYSLLQTSYEGHTERQNGDHVIVIEETAYSVATMQAKGPQSCPLVCPEKVLYSVHNKVRAR